MARKKKKAGRKSFAVGKGASGITGLDLSFLQGKKGGGLVDPFDIGL